MSAFYDFGKKAVLSRDAVTMMALLVYSAGGEIRVKSESIVNAPNLWVEHHTDPATGEIVFTAKPVLS